MYDVINPMCIYFLFFFTLLQTSGKTKASRLKLNRFLNAVLFWQIARPSWKGFGSSSKTDTKLCWCQQKWLPLLRYPSLTVVNRVNLILVRSDCLPCMHGAFKCKNMWVGQLHVCIKALVTHKYVWFGHLCMKAYQWTTLLTTTAPYSPDPYTMSRVSNWCLIVHCTWSLNNLLNFHSHVTKWSEVSKTIV